MTSQKVEYYIIVVSIIFIQNHYFLKFILDNFVKSKNNDKYQIIQ